MSSLITYLRGSCRFSASGVFPERFLNLSSHSDMGLWDIKRTENGISAKIIAGRYKKLLPLARKCRIRLRVAEKSGLPFKLLPYRQRVGMPLGFFIFCGILWLLSRFVWIVDLPQVSPHLQPKVNQAIHDVGIRQGVLRSSLDADRMKNELQLTVTELSWAGISYSGSHVSVDVKELEKPYKYVDSDEPCNIIASREGKIVSVIAADGMATVEAGQTVSKGDMLISGVVEYSDGYVNMTHAQGEVTAMTFYNYSAEVPYTQERPERTGRVVTLRRLMVLGFEVPLYVVKTPEGSFERECDEWQLTVSDSKLPLIVRTERWYEVRKVNRTISREEAEYLCCRQAEEQMQELKDINVIDRKESLVHTDKGVILNISVTALEDIAQPELILFE